MRTCWIFLALLLVLPACQRFTKEGADREVYCLLESRRPQVPEVQGTLDIEAKEKIADAIRERRTFELTLRDALELATVASREYRTQRENVYLTTLTLTRELNEFRPIWDVNGSVDYDFDSDGNTSLGTDMNVLLSRAFERGGGLVIALANDFLTDITGNPLRIAQSILSADITLPLLRGAGELVTLERLRQAERDVLYALRDYALFQQQFTIDIATRFLRALQDRDQWRNAEARYESLKRLVDEQREKAGAGRIPKFEVDQILQDLLTSDDARIRRRNAFETAVDRLKLDIGIPVGVEVVLDDSDLETLRSLGPQPAPYDLDGALSEADERRLDLRTAFDQQQDADRRVLVARNALMAGLDLRGGVDVLTPSDQPFNLDDAITRGTLGIDFDLPVERTAERNVYRRAIIDAGRARRDRERSQDTVVFEVRDAYRTVEEARRSYEIQQESSRLAERRVESTQLLLELGQARTRDRLDAETSRLQARNAVTAALVDHALARLALERDVGTLRVDAEGWWTLTQPQDAAPAGAATFDPTGAAAPTLNAAQADTTAEAATPAPATRPAARRSATTSIPAPTPADEFPAPAAGPVGVAPAAPASATAAAPTIRKRAPIRAAPLPGAPKPSTAPSRRAVPAPVQPAPVQPAQAEPPQPAARPAGTSPAPSNGLPPPTVSPRRSGTVGSR